MAAPSCTKRYSIAAEVVLAEPAEDPGVVPRGPASLAPRRDAASLAPRRAAASLAPPMRATPSAPPIAAEVVLAEPAEDPGVVPRDPASLENTFLFPSLTLVTGRGGGTMLFLASGASHGNQLPTEDGGPHVAGCKHSLARPWHPFRKLQGAGG